MSERKRQYEGPARLFSDEYNEQSLRERYFGRSQEVFLNEHYGPEGTSWEFDTQSQPFGDENAREEAIHEVEFKLASEAMDNFDAGEGYTLDDGSFAKGIKR